jgi:GNAT superfamily N-acetyltransferase
VRSLAEIAALEEHRQARAIADVALESQPIAGGFMSRGEPGTWCNAAVGLGLAGPVDAADVTRMITWFEERAREPRVELCPFADSSLRDELERQSFSVLVFENVFFRELDDEGAISALHPLPSDLEIVRIEPQDEARVHEYAVTVAIAFSASQLARPADIELMARCARHARSTVFAAYAGPRCIAGGGVELCGEVAALFGLSVLPEFRRCGVQQALIAARLREAARRGAKIATISARPGLATERNVRRMGFQVAYTKVALVRPGPGLTPIVEL